MPPWRAASLLRRGAPRPVEAARSCTLLSPSGKPWRGTRGGPEACSRFLEAPFAVTRPVRLLPGWVAGGLQSCPPPPRGLAISCARAASVLRTPRGVGRRAAAGTRLADVRAFLFPWRLAAVVLGDAFPRLFTRRPAMRRFSGGRRRASTGHAAAPVHVTLAVLPGLGRAVWGLSSGWTASWARL